VTNFAAPSISEYLILDFQHEPENSSSSDALARSTRCLSLNISEYTATLNKLGGKVTGLLLALISISQWDHESGWYFLESSQDDIGKLASGGDHGWSPTPTRDALEALIVAGYVRKIPGRALGRNKGSSPPKWVLSNDIFHPDLRIKEQAFFGPSKMASLNKESLNNRTSKTRHPQPAPNPLGMSEQNKGAPIHGGPHGVDEMKIIHSSSNDNEPNHELLSLATVRELTVMGWMNAAAGVNKFGASLLAAWIVTSRSKNNPGGFIRSQTKKAEWPFYPPGWDVDKDRVVLSEDGRLIKSGERVIPPEVSPQLLQVRDILAILDEAGEIGREVKKLWLETVDKEQYPTPSERSYELQKLGTELVSQYGLRVSPMGRVETA